MDKNTEEDQVKNHRKCCNCRTTKTNILILLIVIFNIAISGFLVVAHLYQRKELQEVRRTSAKAIDDCLRRIASINAKHNQDEALENRRNNKFTQRYIIRKSPGKIKGYEERQKVATQEARASTQTSCPYHHSRKRRKLCSFIAREVSRQLNLTVLRQEIKKVLADKDQTQFTYFNVIGVHQLNLDEQNRKGDANCKIIKDALTPAERNMRKRNCNVVKDMYTIKWNGNSRRCKDKNKSPEQLRMCRLIRPLIDRPVPSTPVVEVAGMYLLYCQLTFDVNLSNVAQLISKVTILMSKQSGYHQEHVELISQVPVLTKQGNSKVVSVSMFAQAYLYEGSTVSVTVSFGNNAKLSATSEKKLILHGVNKLYKPYSVFGMHLLLEKKNDGR